MTRITTSTLLALALIAFASPLAAQPLPTAGEAMGAVDTEVETKAVTELDFEGDQVTGDPVRPLEESVRGEGHAKTASLIRVRANFVPEMLKSVEDL